MQRGTPRALFELLSSMRFAISLLTVLAIASAIGTVIRQNEPFNAYLNQFGPFWFPVFEALGLYSVYNAPWFLVILAFLVTSTTLCIVRQTGPMLREMRSFREHAREVSLRQFAHHASFPSNRAPARGQEAVLGYLEAAGFKARVHVREDGALIAAKQGSASRSGYFLAHGAIVLICLGGLLDGNLPLRIQMALGGKAATSGNQLIADIPESARLGPENRSYRANLFIPEGRSASIGVINIDDGILLQELPFTVSLKRFHIDHYENGMPRRFASDVIVTDNETGASFERTIEVNKPLEYRGVAMYQSSFDDGGSTLRIALRSLVPARSGEGRPVEGAVGDTLKLADEGYDYALELTGFRPFNVENLAGADEVGARTGLARFEEHLGSGARTPTRKDLRNIGPSFNFKLRDAAGQAREFQNYMQPIEQDGRWFMFTGVRESQAEAFRYLRIPLDGDGRMEAWFGIHRLIFNPDRRGELARRFAVRSFGDGPENAPMRERLTESANLTAALFSQRGYESVGRFIDSSIPTDERERAADVFVKILQGMVWEAWMMAREEAGQPPLQIDDTQAAFMRDTMMALSDSLFYGAPVYLQLTGYDQRQATVFQVTRSPGRWIVYLGAFLLVLGVFTMLYIRERRLFVLLKNDGEALVALSSNRKTIDMDETFARHSEALRALLYPADGGIQPERAT